MDRFLFEIHEALGIGPKHLAENRLSLHPQPGLQELRIVDIDFEGKPFILLSSAAKAWAAMKASAQAETVELLPFSGFRSFLSQKYLIQRHLKSGRVLEEILTHIAIPGFSEHHSGRAIDIHAAEKPVLEEEFEQSEAFQWLTQNAARFGFSLSYPRSNSLGIIYEPWHWLYRGI